MCSRRVNVIPSTEVFYGETELSVTDGEIIELLLQYSLTREVFQSETELSEADELSRAE